MTTCGVFPGCASLAPITESMPVIAPVAPAAMIAWRRVKLVLSSSWLATISSLYSGRALDPGATSSRGGSFETDFINDKGSIHTQYLDREIVVNVIERIVCRVHVVLIIILALDRKHRRTVPI